MNEKICVNNGTSISFWFDEVLNFKNLFYKIPSQQEIKKNKIKEIF